jgi:rRNA-processing protein FCF1
MRPRHLRLKPGVDPRVATLTLDQLINEGRNVIASVAGGTGIGPGALPLAEAYVRWLEGVETHLQVLTFDFSVVDALQTGRYWRIRQLHEEPIWPTQLVRAEIGQQTSWLEALRDDLQLRIDRVAAAPGDPTVLDTNVLLEFVPPVQIDWTAVIPSPAVRLVIPLRVVEELDVLKYDRRRQDRAERARSVLPQLETSVGNAGTPQELRANTTIEVLIEPSPRHRPTDADEEVLETCRELQQYGQQRVWLVTADTAMRLRAQALNVAVVPMPNEYSRWRSND